MFIARTDAPTHATPCEGAEVKLSSTVQVGGIKEEARFSSWVSKPFDTLLTIAFVRTRDLTNATHYPNITARELAIAVL